MSQNRASRQRLPQSNRRALELSVWGFLQGFTLYGFRVYCGEGLSGGRVEFRGAISDNPENDIQSCAAAA